MVNTESSGFINMSEFELFFNEDKNCWYVRFTDENLLHDTTVSVQFLIDPNNDSKMYWKGEIYQAMLKWLKINHPEMLI